MRHLSKIILSLFVVVTIATAAWFKVMCVDQNGSSDSSPYVSRHVDITVSGFPNESKLPFSISIESKEELGLRRFSISSGPEKMAMRVKWVSDHAVTIRISCKGYLDKQVVLTKQLPEKLDIYLIRKLSTDNGTK